MRFRTGLVTTLVATLFQPYGSMAWACTMSTSSPETEIEIEIEFEDYNDVRDRVLYKIMVESSVVPPAQPTVCQCGITLGSDISSAPDSFRVVDAMVGILQDGNDIELGEFGGFEFDDSVSGIIESLPGVRSGATAFGFSALVNPFNLSPLQEDEKFVLGFLIEFDPDDFAEVNGNLIQFAAGSVEPDHPVNLFQRYQQNLQIPPFQIHACDVNVDQRCDVSDIDAMFDLGPIDQGFPRTDATEIFDLNGDDRISLADLDRWLKEAASFNGLESPYVYGDANLDGTFNSGDLVQVFQFGDYENGVDGQSWATGDWNGDDYFTSGDLVRAFQAGGYSTGVNTVPEPSSIILLVIASLVAIPRTRRDVALVA